MGWPRSQPHTVSGCRNSPHVPRTGRRLSYQDVIGLPGGTQPPRGGKTKQAAWHSTNLAEHARPRGDPSSLFPRWGRVAWQEHSKRLFSTPMLQFTRKRGIEPAKSRLPRPDLSLLSFKRKIPGEIRACFPTLCFSAEQLPFRHAAGGKQAASRGLHQKNGGAELYFTSSHSSCQAVT